MVVIGTVSDVTSVAGLSNRLLFSARPNPALKPSGTAIMIVVPLAATRGTEKFPQPGSVDPARMNATMCEGASFIGHLSLSKPLVLRRTFLAVVFRSTNLALRVNRDTSCVVANPSQTCDGSAREKTLTPESVL